MKKILLFLCALTLVFGMTGVAGAVPITFTDTTTFSATGTNPSEDLDDYGWGTVNKLDTILDYVSWTHHFVFDPPVAEVLSGTLTLSLRDDGGFWDGFEFAFGWAEDGNWDFGEVDTGNYSYNVTASYLEDGAFSITLGSIGGDFFIDQSDLEITYNSIPEPATMLLLGFGLLGLGLARRKS